MGDGECVNKTGISYVLGVCIRLKRLGTGSLDWIPANQGKNGLLSWMLVCAFSWFLNLRAYRCRLIIMITGFHKCIMHTVTAESHQFYRRVHHHWRTPGRGTVPPLPSSLHRTWWRSGAWSCGECTPAKQSHSIIPQYIIIYTSLVILLKVILKKYPNHLLSTVFPVCYRCCSQGRVNFLWYLVVFTCMPGESYPRTIVIQLFVVVFMQSFEH